MASVQLLSRRHSQLASQQQGACKLHAGNLNKSTEIAI